MTLNWSNATGAISVTIALMGWVEVIPAEAQTVSIPPRPKFAYTTFEWGFPPCPGGGCEAGGPEIILGSSVVTPFGQTLGPWDFQPTWSPDATRIAYAGNGVIVLADAAGNAYATINATGSLEWYPAWSPDGRTLAFLSERDGLSFIYTMDLDGTHVIRLAPQPAESLTWSPDSTRLAFACVVESNTDICAVNSDGTGFVRLTDHPGWTASPRGRLMAERLRLRRRDTEERSWP